MNYTVVDLIQSMLAPGIMISACGLLLLGTNNKYSIVVNRIRMLDEEKRRMKWGREISVFNNEETLRTKNIDEQLQLFYRRVRFIRNAVLAYTVAVSLFIVTSILIGCNFAFELNFYSLPLITFLLGMISVFTGSIYMAREVIWGYRIVSIEVKSV